MNQYIINLTNNLIAKNNYDQLFEQYKAPRAFLAHVMRDLCFGDVKNMHPRTLGKIMLSFQIGDVQATKDDLFDGVHFSGHPGDMLRELVSLCLAYAIQSRLDAGVPTVPRWEKRGQRS